MTLAGSMHDRVRDLKKRVVDDYFAEATDPDFNEDMKDDVCWDAEAVVQGSYEDVLAMILECPDVDLMQSQIAQDAYNWFVDECIAEIENSDEYKEITKEQ